MARVMKLDEIADDVGLDVNGDALLARGEQLVKLEVCRVFHVVSLQVRPQTVTSNILRTCE